MKTTMRSLAVIFLIYINGMAMVSCQKYETALQGENSGTINMENNTPFQMTIVIEDCPSYVTLLPMSKVVVETVDFNTLREGKTYVAHAYDRETNITTIRQKGVVTHTIIIN